MAQNELAAIQELYDNSGLLDVLVSFEGYLESMDLYVFDGWFNGTVVSGPEVSKYWVSVVLKYDASKPLDPRGALVFKNSGTTIEVKKEFENVPKRIPQGPDDLSNQEMVLKPVMERVPVVLVKFTVPRKLLDPSSSEEYNIIDAENMANILIDRGDE